MTSSQERSDYYRSASVRDRIREFIGCQNGNGATSAFLTSSDENTLRSACAPDQLPFLFERGVEICRSLSDQESLLADFDIEYVNFDDAARAFVAPERIFELQEPIADVIEQTLGSYGICPLHLLSGRGHHFVWRIRRGSNAFRILAQLGRGPESLWKRTETSEELERAFAGLGLVMEFLAYRIKQIAAPQSAVPVELTAVEVGPSEHGREMISIDLSEYGDPLGTRMMRVPFSVYLKPWQQSWAIDAEVLDQLSQLFVIPAEGITWRQGVRAMRDVRAASELARSSHTIIPDASESMMKLLADYAGSDVAKFHDWFYGKEPHQADQWDETYDRLELQTLPPCARLALEHPNDLLLRPARIRQLVRVLLALGWHPRHIAGLIHSKYARPFGWTQFEGYDPATRAEFYTRIFSGLFVTGREELTDFNCVSAQEQGICLSSYCGYNLMDFKQSALNRRKNDKLAHRPFNRLLLQSEHS